MVPWSQYYDGPDIKDFDEDGPLYEVVAVLIGQIEYTEEEYRELLCRKEQLEK